MTSDIHLMLEALAVGAVRVDAGFIRGHGGYVDQRSRVIVVNTSAPLSDQTDAVRDGLAVLTETYADPPPDGDLDDDETHVRPVLWLAHSAAEIEEPASAETTPSRLLRVVAQEQRSIG